METIIGAGTGAAAQNAGDLIKDVGQKDFAKEVIQASLKTPEVVDFWAPWCNPCKQLGPILEKAVTAARGAVILVKVNIDENQELAAQLRIQASPRGYAFGQGQPVERIRNAVAEQRVAFSWFTDEAVVASMNVARASTVKILVRMFPV